MHNPHGAVDAGIFATTIVIGVATFALALVFGILYATGKTLSYIATQIYKTFSPVHQVSVDIIAALNEEAETFGHDEDLIGSLKHHNIEMMVAGLNSLFEEWHNFNDRRIAKFDLALDNTKKVFDELPANIEVSQKVGVIQQMMGIVLNYNSLKTECVSLIERTTHLVASTLKELERIQKSRAATCGKLIENLEGEDLEKKLTVVHATDRKITLLMKASKKFKTYLENDNQIQKIMTPTTGKDDIEEEWAKQRLGPGAEKMAEHETEMVDIINHIHSTLN